MMMSAENTAAFAAVECNMITPCTAPPPNGAPRYVLPSSQYDPAKAAEERFAKALEEEATKKRNFEMKMKAEEEEEEKEEASKAPEEEVVDSSTDSTASSSSFEE